MVIGSSATWGIDYSDWVLRVCAPASRYMNGDSDAAAGRIREALQTGVVHGSLLKPGPAAKYT